MCSGSKLELYDPETECKQSAEVYDPQGSKDFGTLGSFRRKQMIFELKIYDPKDSLIR